VRENRDGSLVTLVYGRAISQHIDPIEKKPLFHSSAAPGGGLERSLHSRTPDLKEAVDRWGASRGR
jgi:hypothetical protein